MGKDHQNHIGRSMAEVAYLTFILFLLKSSWANAEMLCSTRSSMFTSAKSSSKSRARLRRKHTRREWFMGSMSPPPRSPTVFMASNLTIPLRFFATQTSHVQNRFWHFRSQFLHLGCANCRRWDSLDHCWSRICSKYVHFIIFARWWCITRENPIDRCVSIPVGNSKDLIWVALAIRSRGGTVAICSSSWPSPSKFFRIPIVDSWFGRSF